MRYITFILFLFFTACSDNKNTTLQSDSMNGIWKPVKQEMGGQSLQSTFFEKQRLTINDSNYTVVAESVDKGVVKVNGDRMDIYGREGVNSGKHFTARYKLQNGELSICYNLSGDSYPPSFDTKGQQMYFLSVYKKETQK